MYDVCIFLKSICICQKISSPYMYTVYIYIYIHKCVNLNLRTSAYLYVYIEISILPASKNVCHYSEALVILLSDTVPLFGVGSRIDVASTHIART